MSTEHDMSLSLTTVGGARVAMRRGAMRDFARHALAATGGILVRMLPLLVVLIAIFGVWQLLADRPAPDVEPGRALERGWRGHAVASPATARSGRPGQGTHDGAK